jgi:hypothetical protein
VTVRFQRRAEQAAPSAGRRRSGVAQGRRVDARAPPGRTADVALDLILELVERRRLATAEFGSCSRQPPSSDPARPARPRGQAADPFFESPGAERKTTEAGVAAVALMTEAPRAKQMERNTWTEKGWLVGVDPGEHRRGSGPQASGSILTVWTPLLAKKVDRGRATPLAEAANMKENRRRPGLFFLARAPVASAR